MKLDLEAAQERARKYLEHCEKGYAANLEEANWFQAHSPKSDQQSDRPSLRLIHFVLDETWHLEYEDFFLLTFNCWEETPTGPKETFLGGGGPILVDRATDRVYYPFTVEEDEDIELVFKKRRSIKEGQKDKPFSVGWSNPG